MHDYSGHAFVLQLSRQLARQGHEVRHLYCPSYISGKGRLDESASDPPGMSVEPIPMRDTFERYRALKRIQQEVRYGRALSKRLIETRPDVAVFCNTPLLVHLVATVTCSRHGIPMVFWQQDVYCLGISAAARQRFGPLGLPVAVAAEGVERWIARRSQVIVPIADGFLPMLRKWGVDNRASVVPNWGPLDEIPERSRNNSWAEEHDLVGRKVALYSGTLGLKHNPVVLLRLAERMRDEQPEWRTIVVSEGAGRDWLAQEQLRLGLDTLVLLNYQAFVDFPNLLASADVLVAILEPKAGAYSVPSKILSYLCAGRPIVGVLPHANAAAATLRGSRGGIVTRPDDLPQAVATILDVMGADTLRAEMGAAGRSYAEATFGIRRIADQFESLLTASVRAHASQG